jgi:uncharacterized protein (DUF302 family)
MEIYLSKTLANITFEEAETLVTEKLKEQGFGVITEIDVKATFKKKLDVDFKPYKILGACNPTIAHAALSKDDKIGVMLPCNVCLQQSGLNDIEVFTINPLVAMQPFASADFAVLGDEVYSRLTAVLNSL